MFLFKKGIGPVVAVALLLVVVVVAATSFQGWYESYSSFLFVGAEQDSNIDNFNLGIEGIYGNELYINAGSGLNITKVTIDNIDCSTIQGYYKGIESFDLSSCISNVSTSFPEVVLFLENRIISEYVYLENSFFISSFVYLWNLTYDGGYFEVPYFINFDSEDNFLVVGFSNDGSNDNGFMIKYNSDGVYLWNKSIDLFGNNDYLYGVDFDSSNNIYVSGESYSGSNWDGFVAKYNSSGSHIWNRTFNGGNNEQFNELIIDSEENVFISGFSNDGSSDNGFMIKYNSDGVYLWNKSIDLFGNNDYLYGVDFDSSNNIYVSGESYSGSNWDGFVAKYNSSGSHIWNRTFNGGNNDQFAEIKVHNSNSIIVSGFSNDGSSDNFLIVKYDFNGNYLWNKTFDIYGFRDRIFGLSIDSYNNIFLGGSSDDGSSQGYYILKLNENGNSLWNFSLNPSNLIDVFNGINLDSNDNLYATGSYYNGVNDDWQIFKFNKYNN